MNAGAPDGLFGRERQEFRSAQLAPRASARC